MCAMNLRRILPLTLLLGLLLAGGCGKKGALYHPDDDVDKDKTAAEQPASDAQP
jgi:predicted small lipoprotein YifL